MESSLQPVKHLVKMTTGFLIFALSLMFFVPQLVAQNNTYIVHLPLITRSLTAPNLLPLVRGDAENSWVATWTHPGSDIVRYEIRESATEAFDSPLFYFTTDTSNTFSYPASISNSYCYQVRAYTATLISDWSNSRCIVGDYFDDFEFTNSGWATRREDTDDVNNDTYYENGSLVVKIRGRWDYAIASSLGQAPEGPYEIETRVRLAGVDNLHAYGIIFGGDWNGQQCPNNDFSSCFTHYYRLLIIWHGSPDSLRMSLKRIDSHDPSDNAGRGVTLINHRDVNVGNPDEWNTWKVQVHEDGNIVILVNDRIAASATDPTYFNSRYFGVLAATDEYLGAEPHFDTFAVRSLR